MAPRHGAHPLIPGRPKSAPPPQGPRNHRPPARRDLDAKVRRRAFSSRLVGTRHLGVFEERLGPLYFRFELHPTPTGVVWALIGWGLPGLPLPRALGPKVSARADEANGRYRFRKVFGGLNWNPELRAPLSEPGVEAKAGEYLLAVGGKDLVPPENLYARFEGTSGKIAASEDRAR